MQARDIMSTRVVTVSPDVSVEEIAKLLLDSGVSAVPVVDQAGRPVGIVSEGDLMRRSESGTEGRRSWWLRLLAGPEDAARDYIKRHGHTAADVMTSEMVTVAEETPVAEIAATLEKRHIKRVPVLKDGKLIGIVSRADLLRGLAAHKAPLPPLSTPDDHAIRKAVLDLVAREDWVSHGSFGVIVTDGKVELWGLVDSDEERHALKIAIGDIEGVREVESHLGLVPPYLRAT